MGFYESSKSLLIPVSFVSLTSNNKKIGEHAGCFCLFVILVTLHHSYLVDLYSTQFLQ